MKRLFGSLFNRLDENRKPPTPEVGMGATVLIYSDRHAATVTKILSPKRILIQEDYANRTDKNGVSDSQEYEYRPNPNAAEREFSLRKDGRWKEAKGATVLMLGERDHYYDYSFYDRALHIRRAFSRLLAAHDVGAERHRCEGHCRSNSVHTAVKTTDTHTVFTQVTKGWFGSGFKHKTTELRVRRVDRNEAQIEIVISEVKLSGRLFTTTSSFTIAADYIDAFVGAVLNVKGRVL